MKFSTQTGKTIADSFAEFHAANPKVYDLFKEQVYRAIRNRKEAVSSKQIINWIRWEVSLNINTKDTYKINDAFTSHYARLFIKDHPHYADMFELRELRDGSEKGAGHRVNESYRVSILQKMIDGMLLIHYPTNNTIVLIPADLNADASEQITTVSFNKMLRDKYISATKKSQLLHEYQITDSGKDFVKTGGK